MPALLTRIRAHLALEAMTANGRTLGENLACAEVYDDDVIRPLDRPIYAEGALAVLLADYVGEGNPLLMSAAALAVLFGHAFSPFMKFKGGKAVASFAGAFAYLTPLPFWSIAILFVAIVWYSRYISLGSICGALLFPFAVWLILHPAWPVLMAATVAGVFIAWRHSENIERLRAGKENRFEWRKK
jgi:glycerol-3-phosphate acyltransferase PlsY